jgi:hypothetical protein
VEQVDELCVGKDVLAEKAIRKMAIGEIKPQEEDDEDCKIEETTILPPVANPIRRKIWRFRVFRKLQRKVRRFWQSRN